MRILKYISLVLGVLMLNACGEEPSDLLRQGQLPINDFPMYLSDGADGKIWKLTNTGEKSILVEDLEDPRGLATDRFHNLYAAEYGAGRILKINTEDGSYEVMREGLEQPAVVAVDSFNEVYATQDGAQNIIRVSDGKVMGQYDAIPSALVFGVDDIMIVGLFDSNLVFWGDESKQIEVNSPVNAAIDGTGRVFISQADAEEGKVTRFQQKGPDGGGVDVATGLSSPTGTAVDPVGNIYVIEQFTGRIVLITHDGELFQWMDGFVDPQYLAFTK